MKTYRVEIFGYMEVDAESEKEAIQIVKDDLNEDPFAIVDKISFEAEDLTQEEDEDD